MTTDCLNLTAIPIYWQQWQFVWAWIMWLEHISVILHFFFFSSFDKCQINEYIVWEKCTINDLLLEIWNRWSLPPINKQQLNNQKLDRIITIYGMSVSEELKIGKTKSWLCRMVVTHSWLRLNAGHQTRWLLKSSSCSATP